MRTYPMFHLAKRIKGKSQNKARTDLMLWHLDQDRKAKQGVSIFNIQRLHG